MFQKIFTVIFALISTAKMQNQIVYQHLGDSQFGKVVSDNLAIYQQNMNSFTQVLPFLNMTRGAQKLNFKGIWSAENSFSPFVQSQGESKLILTTKSYKYTNIMDLNQYLFYEAYEDLET